MANQNNFRYDFDYKISEISEELRYSRKAKCSEPAELVSAILVICVTSDMSFLSPKDLCVQRR